MAAEMTKTTALATMAALVGPLAAEYSLILAAATVGAIVSLSLRAEPWPGIWRPIAHVMLGAVVAMIATPLAAAVAVALAPAGWGISLQLMQPVVALSIGTYWHRAATDWVPRLIGRRVG